MGGGAAYDFIFEAFFQIHTTMSFINHRLSSFSNLLLNFQYFAAYQLSPVFSLSNLICPAINSPLLKITVHNVFIAEDSRYTAEKRSMISIWRACSFSMSNFVFLGRFFFIETVHGLFIRYPIQQVFHDASFRFFHDFSGMTVHNLLHYLIGTILPRPKEFVKPPPPRLRFDPYNNTHHFLLMILIFIFHFSSCTQSHDGYLT